MVEIGSVIEAVVTRVEPYGVILRHGDEEVVVLIPEISWEPVREIKERFPVGKRLPVYVLRYNYQDRKIVGSFRRLHPEENPYRQLSRLPPGQILEGKVIFAHGQDVSVLLANGARGQIPKYRLKDEIPVGESVPVKIAALEVEDGRLWLEPALTESEPSDGTSVSTSAAGRRVSRSSSRPTGDAS